MSRPPVVESRFEYSNMLRGVPPPGGNALAVLYRRYCVELKVYEDG